MPETLIRKLITEFIGTFVLVFTIVCVVEKNAALAAVAIGSALMVSVYAGGHISGGHYNPAVSLAVFIRGRLPAAELIPYWVSQLVGAALAAGLGLYVTDASTGSPSSFTARQAGSAFTAEVIFTFVLAYVVLNVATSRDQQNNSFFGLAIGFTVLVGAVAVGPISGGAFNPAVAFGASIAGIGPFCWANFWVYLVGCPLGAAVAGFAFKYLNPTDK